MTTSRLLPLAILLPLALLGACSDDATEPGPPRTDLLTLNLGESFVREYGEEGWLFVSGPDGAVLDVARWSGTGTLVLENAEERPDTVTLTILFVNHAEFVLVTELGIPVGASRTFDGVIRDGAQHQLDLTFLNAPETERWRIALGGGSVSGEGSLPSHRTVHYNGVANDCWVGLDPVDAVPVGAWLRGIEPGGADTLDLAEPGVTETLQRHAIAIPEGARLMSCQVIGDASTPETRDRFLFDDAYADGSVPDSAVVHVPAFDPARLSTSVFLYLDGEPTVSLSQATVGPVPPAFTPLAGDLAITSADLDSVAFSFTGPWDACNVHLRHGGELYGLWWFSGPAPASSFVVPDLPEEITSEYPDYPRDVFTLSRVEVMRTTAEGDRSSTRGRALYTTGRAKELAAGMSADRGGPWRAGRGWCVPTAGRNGSVGRQAITTR